MIDELLNGGDCIHVEKCVSGAGCECIQFVTRTVMMKLPGRRKRGSQRRFVDVVKEDMQCTGVTNLKQDLFLQI